jgi:hypothetical protein
VPGFRRHFGLTIIYAISNSVAFRQGLPLPSLKKGIYVNTALKISIAGYGKLGRIIGIEFHARAWRVTAAKRLAPIEQDLWLNELICLDFSDGVAVNANDSLFDAEVLVICLPPSVGLSCFENLARKAAKQDNLKVVLISSTSVYEQLPGMNTEESKLGENPRARRQLAVERAIWDFCSRSIVLRCGGLIGPNRHPGRFFAEGKGKGNGQKAVNMVDERDVARAVLHLLKHKKKGIFNCVFPDHPTRKEYYGKAANQIGREIPEFETNDRCLPATISSEKLTTETGFVFQHDIRLFGLDS